MKMLPSSLPPRSSTCRGTIKPWRLGLILASALLGVAHAAPATPAAKFVGCWDNDESGPAHKALCFADNGRIEQREDGRFDTGHVAWAGTYSVAADGGSLEFRTGAQAARAKSCRVSFRTERLRYFDKVAGSRIAKDWPQLRLDDCDLAGVWLKACDKFQASYGTCPRLDVNR